MSKFWKHLNHKACCCLTCCKKLKRGERKRREGPVSIVGVSIERGTGFGGHFFSTTIQTINFFNFSKEGSEVQKTKNSPHLT